MAAGGHGEAVNLGLDVDGLLGIRLEPSNINLDVEVTNAKSRVRKHSLLESKHSLGDDGILGHSLEVLRGDDVPVASGGHEDIATGSSLLHGGDLVAGHGRLESVDGVDLGDDNTSTVRAERLSALYALWMSEHRARR